MNKTVSLLLGSGFSVPEGLPTVSELNLRMSKIREEEILIHTDMSAMFLNGQVDKNRWCRADERVFVQDFLEFYNSQVLQNGEQFHYETFYDYYSLYLSGSQNNETIEEFCKEFIRIRLGGKDTLDSYNRVSSFNRTYNQLIASLLHNPQYFEDATGSGHWRYNGFISYLKKLLETHEVKVHTLNHDLFFDWLGSHQSGLFEHFSDGFEFEGSPFYGMLYDQKKIGNATIHKGYRVKLAQFTGRFDTRLCFYKLHGSILNTVVYTPDGGIKRVRWEYGVDDITLETKNEVTGKYSFVGVHDEVDPDFLSGTTNKIRLYTADPFYKTLLGHFERNLTASDSLLVIGYGFQDPGINVLLEKNYLSKDKKMIIVDPGTPNPEFLEKYDVAHIKESIGDTSFETLNQFMTD